MAQFRLTLQNRITSLMVISTILFISAFLVIQLNNQLNNLAQYNIYKARLSTIIVKNTLAPALIQNLVPEQILAEGEVSPRQDTNFAGGPENLQAGFLSLVQTKIIDSGLIIDKDDKIIASTEQADIGNYAGARDITLKDRLFASLEENKPFESEIDRLNRKVHIYIPLTSSADTNLKFLVKISFSLGNIQEALTAVYRPAIIAAILIILANFGFGYLLSKTVIGPIKILNDATKVIASGKLELRVNIRTEDELEELASTFNDMTLALIKMKERAENANPLTKIPGNIVIREEVEKRINANMKFVVIHTDLNNFKAFNDKYGLLKGDEAIKMNADILKESLEHKGNPDDVLGHEGGDDFILITTPEKAEGICEYLIAQFDSRVRSLYSQEDLNAGFIIAHSRQGEITKFPIMSISLAGVTNEHRPISSYAEVTNIAAEVKKKAKSLEKSVLVLDKRK